MRKYDIIILVNSMNSRMERYNEDDGVISETRTSKNRNLYDTISNGDFSHIPTDSNFKLLRQAETILIWKKSKNI